MAIVGPTSRELLDFADDMMSEARPTTSGRWPRATAILLRQALERSLEELWDRKEPPLMAASERAQLLCLGSYIDRRLAGRAHATWIGLSRACHHHPYELPPTATELGGWFTEVEALSKEVSRIIGVPNRHTSAKA